MGEWADYWGGKERTRCSACRGTGEFTPLHMTDVQACPKCGGNGTVEVPHNAALDGPNGDGSGRDA